MATSSRSVRLTASWEDAIWADSCSFADVQAAIDLADTGDTVRIPAGSATWDYRLHVTKALLIIGAGIGSTVITCNYSRTTTGITQATSYFISYVPSDPTQNLAFRLSGMTIDCDNKAGGLFIQNNTINVLNRIRLDNLRVVNNLSYCLMGYGTIYGVMDNCELPTGQFRFLGHSSTWATYNYDFGEQNQFYIEDCDATMLSDNPYLEGGARVCFRHNTASIGADAYSLFHPHAWQGNSYDAAFGIEVYGNTFTQNGFTVQFSNSEGGKTLWYDNDHNGGTVLLKVSSRYPYYGEGGEYPEFSPDGQHQHTEETYIFNNRDDGSTILGNGDFPYLSGTVSCPEHGYNVPVENLQFWKHVSSFDGSTGVGVGLLSARPSSGLTVGVGYWATDTSTLYRATSATEWETYYTPYTYPHPLRSDPELGD